jgi:pyruvoyl-dependent arginine decarboxylase
LESFEFVNFKKFQEEPIMYVPRYMFFTKGVGVHKEKLASFENALRDAKIAHLNLVTVSSIFPPHCRVVDIDTGLPRLEPGEITHCVMARQEINEPGRRIVASIGLALPAESGKYGYFQNIMDSDRPKKRPGSMPKIWRHPCWPIPLVSNLIRTRIMMKEGIFIKCPEKLLNPGIRARRLWGLKETCGQRFLQPLCLSNKRDVV